MGIFEGILICTDLDGTLIKTDGTISNENLDAIEFFKREGGLFTFITGRMPFYAYDIYDAIKPNVPIGCINGGGLYDYNNQQYIWTAAAVPSDVVELIKNVDENVSGAGIQVNTFYKAYFCKDNQTMKYFRKATNLPNLVCDYAEVKEPIAKIIFGSEEEEDIFQIEKILKSHHNADNFDFIRSEFTLYEILPKGIGKGTAIVKLCEHLGVDINKTIAIGDYDNDISMLKAAKIGIAVSNACEAAKAAADYITVSNDEHAIARVINDLKVGKYIL